ncbi:hypothetical protein N9543_03465 [Flavobacteriaceae bacterium]|nr:hypothetical protein [Flavobacteriaceae bacterium]
MIVTLISTILLLFFLIKDYKKQFASPYFWLLIGYAFYFLPNLWSYILNSKYSILSKLEFVYYNNHVLIIIIITLLFRKYLIFERLNSINSIRFLDQRLIRTITLGSLFIYFIGSVYQIGLSNYFNLNRAATMVLKADQSGGLLLEGILAFSQIFFFIELHKMMYNKEPFKKYMFFYIVILSIILFPTGARGKLISVIFGLLFLLSYFKKINPNKLILPGFFASIFFQLFGKIRHLTTDISLIGPFLRDNFSWEMLNITKGGESVANVVSFIDVFNNGNIIRPYGSRFYSIINSYELLIPKFITKRDFNGLNYWFVEKFYPEIFLAGGGKGFSLIAEGLIIDQYIGSSILLILCFLTIFLIKKLISINSSYSYFSQIFMCAILLELFQLPRLTFAALLKAMIIFGFVPIISVYVFNHTFKKKN